MATSKAGRSHFGQGLGRELVQNQVMYSVHCTNAQILMKKLEMQLKSTVHKINVGQDFLNCK